MNISGDLLSFRSQLNLKKGDLTIANISFHNKLITTHTNYVLKEVKFVCDSKFKIEIAKTIRVVLWFNLI